jgi:hypothetical protein
MVEGRPTGDGRFVVPGALRWENLPLPLTWNRQGGGHEDRVVVGSIETVERDGEFIVGSGVLLTGEVPEAEAVIPLIENSLVGLSVELDDETAVIQPLDGDGNPMGDPEEPLGILIAADAPPPPAPEEDCPEGQHRDPDTGECVADVEAPAEMQYRVTDGRIRNAAIVDTPAFIECTITLDAAPVTDPGVVAALAAGLRFLSGRSAPSSVVAKPETLLAGAVGPHETGTSTEPWDGPANESKLGSPMPLERVRAAYAWYDPGQADADGLYPKSAARFIHHFVADGGAPGQASTVAASTGIGVLHGGRGGTTIPDADVQGVYDHLAKHLRDAGQEPPELSAILTGQFCDDCRAGRCDTARTFAVPDSVAAEARRFVAWRRAGRQGGTAAAAERAKTLARGGTLDYAQVRRLYQSAARLEGHVADVGWEQGDAGFPSPGRVAWAAAGGEAGWAWARTIVEGFEGPLVTYTAMTAAGTKAPPAAWFRDPKLPGPTTWTVTDEGRVYGHLATWDTCHMSVAGVCRTPPRSPAGYAYFHAGGPFRLDDGTTIRAGKVTFGTNHADKALASGPTAEHYEHTGHVAADVVCGEDRWGIWIAGALRPTLSDGDRLAVERASISGDWRAPSGRLELMAALLVNYPGFPVVETMVASGEPCTLIVAGVVEADLADTARPDSHHDPRLEEAAEALAATIGRDRRSLVAAMSVEVHGGL